MQTFEPKKHLTLPYKKDAKEKMHKFGPKMHLTLPYKSYAKKKKMDKFEPNKHFAKKKKIEPKKAYNTTLQKLCQEKKIAQIRVKKICNTSL